MTSQANKSGVPDPTTFGDPSSLPLGRELPFVIQEHKARRAGCFAPGTPVLLADGTYKSIEHTTGNSVVTNNGVARVIRVMYNGPAEQWVRVRAGNREVIVTPMHSFYVADIGWTPICTLTNVKSQLDREGVIHVEHESISAVQDLRQRVLDRLGEHGHANVFSKMRSYSWAPADWAPPIQDAGRHCSLAQEVGLVAAQKEKSKTEVAGRLPVATGALHGAGLGPGRDSKGSGVLSYGCEYGAEPLGDRQACRAQRAYHGQVVWGTELELERRGLQPRNYRQRRWQLPENKSASCAGQGTGREMRVVRRYRRTDRDASHCTMQVLRKQQAGEPVVALHEMPRDGGRRVLQTGGELLCVEWLPRAIRERVDLEVEGAHCYIANGFLVHNSHRDIRLGKGNMFSWATRKPGLPAPGEMQALFQTPLHDEDYMHYEGTLPKGSYGAGSVRQQEKGSVIVLKAGPDKIVFTTAHGDSPQTFAMIRSGAKPTDWLVRNVTAKDQESGMATKSAELYGTTPGIKVGAYVGSHSAMIKLRAARKDGKAAPKVDPKPHTGLDASSRQNSSFLSRVVQMGKAGSENAALLSMIVRETAEEAPKVISQIMRRKEENEAKASPVAPDARKTLNDKQSALGTSFDPSLRGPIMFNPTPGILVKNAISEEELARAAKAYAPVTHETMYTQMPSNLKDVFDSVHQGMPLTAEAPAKGAIPVKGLASTYAAAHPQWRGKQTNILMSPESMHKALPAQLGPVAEVLKNKQVAPWLKVLRDQFGDKIPELRGTGIMAAAQGIRTKAQQQALRNMIQVHEGAEGRYGRKLNRFMPSFASHVSPGVILEESNLARTLPKHLQPVKNFMAALRAPMEERSIRQVMPSFRYGETPVSRGMRKGLTRAIESRDPQAQKTLASQQQITSGVNTVRSGITSGMNWLNSKAAPYLTGKQKATDILGSYLSKIKL